jgi:hypothetical protein
MGTRYPTGHVVIDVDFSVVAMPPDSWVRCRLTSAVNELGELGIMAAPVRIEIERDGRP